MLYDPSKELDAPSKHLLRAAEAVRQRGWCIGDYEDHGAVCVDGALRVTNEGGDTYIAAKSRLATAVGTCAIPEWNDLCCKSQEQAIEALIKAAYLPVSVR